MHILQILLGRFVTAEKMDEKFAADFIERTSEELNEAKESLEATQLMVEQDLKNRSDLVKDPLALEEALENSRLDYIRKMVSICGCVGSLCRHFLKFCILLRFNDNAGFL